MYGMHGPPSPRPQASDMRSEGRNLDVFRDCPQVMLERAIAQLEVAKVDPNFYGAVKEERVKYYEREVEKWRSIASQCENSLTQQ